MIRLSRNFQLLAKNQLRENLRYVFVSLLISYRTIFPLF